MSACAATYGRLLQDLPVVRPWQDPEGHSAYHLYVIRLKSDQLSRTRADVFASLREQGIGGNVHYIPVYRQPYFEKLGFARGDFPEAERYYSEAISLPMFPTLTANEQQTVVSALKKALGV